AAAAEQRQGTPQELEAGPQPQDDVEAVGAADGADTQQCAGQEEDRQADQPDRQGRVRGAGRRGQTGWAGGSRGGGPLPRLQREGVSGQVWLTSRPNAKSAT